jgi:hypothetical protein
LSQRHAGHFAGSTGPGSGRNQGVGSQILGEITGRRYGADQIEQSS